MQEEVNNKTVALVVRASKLTASTLYRALRLYIEHQKKLEMQYKAKKAANKTQPAIDENIVTTSEKEYPLIPRWKIEKENYRLVAEYNHRCRRCHKVRKVL